MACSLRVASCGHSFVYVDKDLYTTERRGQDTLYTCVDWYRTEEVGSRRLCRCR